MPDYDFKSLLDAIRRQESSRNRDDPNETTKPLPLVNPESGARGPMQVVPKAAMDPGYAAQGAKDVFDIAEDLFGEKFERDEATAKELLDIPEVNRAYADAYMRAMIERFDGDIDKAVGAYNAGPGRMLDADGKYYNLPAETQQYIDNVRQYYNQSTGDNYGITVSPTPRMRPGSVRPQARPAGLLG